MSIVKPWWKRFSQNLFGASSPTEISFDNLPTTHRHPLPSAQHIDFILVEAGSFIMGFDVEDPWAGEEIYHKVTLNAPFYLATTPITNAQWQAVMGAANPNSRFQGSDNPVENVSWNDIMLDGQEGGDKKSFIERLKACKLPGFDFTLPTEAQWEYAAKGGHKTKLSTQEEKDWQSIKPSDRYTLYAGSGLIKEVAQYDNNSKQATQPVGRKRPNELGLFDLSGNVWEWCLDSQRTYSKQAYVDTPAGIKGTFRVVRGGSWFHEPRGCRVSNRYGDDPDDRWSNTGFRLALSSQV
jgi:formylglycine-generating enzyme